MSFLQDFKKKNISRKPFRKHLNINTFLRNLADLHVYIKYLQKQIYPLHL
jgi:hypothetical protein